MLKLATFRGVTPEGEPLNRIFRPGDSIRKTAGTMMPEIQEWLSGYKTEPGKIVVLVNALGASEYWGNNTNGDAFFEAALVHDCRNHSGQAHPHDDFTGKIIPPYGYWTFLQALPFCHHQNKSPNRAFGKVVLACWNPRMHRVELVVILDKELAMQHGAQHVIDQILAGEFPCVSMGCRVPYDSCLICGHKSKTRKDYCNCIRYIGMGKILDDGRQIGVDNTYPRFFDISFVFIGADKTAKVMCKLASGLWVPQSVLDAEEVYGMSNEDGKELIKAASIQVPRNFYFSKEASVLSQKGKDALDAIVEGKESPDVQIQIKKKYEGTILGRTKDGNGELLGVLDPSTMDKVISTLRALKPDHPFLKKLGQNNLTTGAGIGGVDLAADDIAKGPPEPQPLMSKEDTQENEERRAIADGALKTNADVNETDEFPAPLYPENSGAQTKIGAKISQLEHYGSMKRVWDSAKRMKIGPPPKPNRKEYPFTGTIDFRGLMIHVENKPGTIREGKGWETNMRIAYGEFQGTRGVDKDKLDVYVGPYRKAPNVFIIHQNFVRGPKKGKYDEDKVMVGFESPDQAKQAYLAHYDSPKYFRSITTMAFPLFKRAIMKKEVHGEKVASQLTNEMEKVAVDLKLEDLFTTHKVAQRRERTWKKSNGVMTKSIGSGMDDWDQVKTASAGPPTNLINRLLNKYDVKENYLYEAWDPSHLNPEKKLEQDVKNWAKPFRKTAAPLDPIELLKVSNTPKTSSQLKWADIVKKIGPGKAVGKVSPMLSDSEPELPRETLNEMGSSGLESGLSTPSLMGMVLKPREFQRSYLCNMGKEDLADKLDDAGAVFKPTDQEEAPCGPLGSSHMSDGLLEKLLPHLASKSYFGPPVRQRIIRITIIRPPTPGQDTEVDSPLLSKVSAAYNWYRKEQMKLATEAPWIVQSNPKLHAAVHGMSEEDLFGKMASKKINTKTLAVVLGAIPLTLMYSAHLRGKQGKGEELGMLKELVADHPWLSTIATSAALKKIMGMPQAQQAVEEMFSAGKRIASAGKSAL